MGKVKRMSSKLMSGEACRNQKKHKLFRFLVGAALLVIAIFVVYTLISDMIQIQKDTETYNSLVEQTNAVKEQNAQISNYLEDDEKLEQYIEDIARDKLDLASPNDRIYNVVPSAD